MPGSHRLMCDRDVLYIVDFLPKSNLCRLEQYLPLPLGCEEAETVQMPHSTRLIYTFFLADMSLKSILARILASPDLGFEILNGDAFARPVTNELCTQLTLWKQSLPSFLDWNSGPNKGTVSAVGSRLKLVYWFAQFSLHQSLIAQILGNLDRPIHFSSWSLFQDALDVGFALLEVVVREEADIDVMMGSRVCSVIRLLKRAVSLGCFRDSREKSNAALLELCTDMIRNQLAERSELIGNRLQSM